MSNEQWQDRNLSSYVPPGCDIAVSRAIRIAERYGPIGGGHHVRWVVSEMIRELLGQQHYAAWLQAYNEEAEADGYAKWDEGIAP